MRMTMSAMRASGVLLVSLLALCSCGLLFVTPFSTDLAQTLAVRDFSAEIDDPSFSEFQPFVLEVGTGRVILLVAGQLPGGQPYPGHKPWLFVLDENLSLAQKPFTCDELGAIIGVPVKGSRAMVDSNGQIVVGNVLFTVVGTTIAPIGVAGGLGGLYEWGFPMAAAGGNIANVGSSGLTLDWEGYNCSWTSMGSASKSIRASARYIWLRAVFAGPDPATTTAILAFEESDDSATDTSTTFFVRVPKSRFDGTLDDNFLDLPMIYPSTTKTDLEGSHMGYTDDGIVAYDQSSQSWIIFPFDAPNAVQSTRVGDISDDLDDLRIAWSYSGGYSCVYDMRSRTLSKVAKWWN